MVTIYINFFSNQGFFLLNFFKTVVNRKEPELDPEFVISAPAPGGDFISAPAPQHGAEATHNKGTGKTQLPSGVTARAGPLSKNDMAQG
jgi:hypothetical protein